MSTISFQRSKGSLTKSFCQARNSFVPSGQPALGIYGIVPVWGFGNFAAGSGFSNPVYSEVWPLVYKTLIETWVETSGFSRTKTTEFSQDFDIYQVITDSGGTPTHDSDISVTIDSPATTLTVTYWCNAGHTFSGTYTATVSNRWDPNDSLDGWAARTAQAMALMNRFNINDIPLDYWTFANPGFPPELWGCFPVFPVSYGSRWSVGRLFINSPGASIIHALASGNDQMSGHLTAACYGMGVRANTTDGSNAPLGLVSEPESFDLSVIDYIPVGLNPKLLNQGAIICSKFGWVLSGSSQSSNPNTNNHLTVYKQSLIVDPISGLPSLSSISPATVLPGGYSNPIPAGTYVEFGPQDVINNMSSSPNYGVLGFRSIPA